MSELQNFCRDILTAIETGNHPAWFKDSFGLCVNASFYDRAKEITEYNITEDNSVEVILIKLFSGSFPFNENGGEHYDERQNGTLYKNKKRLAFLKEHANI